jgi:DNA-binding beta-propeller fold protein YncE
MMNVLSASRINRCVLFEVTAIVLAIASACSGGGSGGTAHSTPSQSLPNPFTITARFSPASLGLNNPRSLAVGPDDNLYVTDVAPSVTVFSPDGKVLRRWGKAGAGRGEFQFGCEPSDPTDCTAPIAVGSRGVYVSDTVNNRVEIFSPTGDFIRQLGGPGVSPGQFQTVFDLAVDQKGNAYVADDLAQSVSKFSPTGSFMWRIVAGIDRIQVFDRSHKLIAGWYPDSPIRVAPRFTANGEAIALALDGTILKLRIKLPEG